MKYDHNQICTTDGEIVEGKCYQYYESLPLCIMNIRIIEDRSDGQYIRFLVEKVGFGFPFPVVDSEPFEISALKGHYAYGGMWRLYDLETYRTR